MNSLVDDFASSATAIDYCCGLWAVRCLVIFYAFILMNSK